MLPNSSAAAHKHLSVTYSVEGFLSLRLCPEQTVRLGRTLRAILVWSALGVNEAKVSFLGKLGLDKCS